MTSDSFTDRDGALRSLLVEKAATEGRPPRRPRRWAVAIGAFALAGTLAGAGIVTSAVGSADQSARVFRLGAAADQQTRSLGTLVGSPVVVDGTGAVHLPLGTTPSGATRVVVAFECFAPGSVVASAASDTVTSGCSADNPQVVELSVAPVRPQTVTVTAAAGSRILGWASWMRDRPVPAPSAQQRADLSDGIVTHREYLAAYSRYTGCMAEAGYPMSPITGAPPFVFYAVPSAAVDDGSEATCYAREFRMVDEAWQSALGTIITRCLAAQGIDGKALNLEEGLAELRRTGTTPESCSPELQ